MVRRKHSWFLFGSLESSSAAQPCAVSRGSALASSQAHTRGNVFQKLPQLHVLLKFPLIPKSIKDWSSEKSSSVVDSFYMLGVHKGEDRRALCSTWGWKGLSEEGSKQPRLWAGNNLEPGNKETMMKRTSTKCPFPCCAGVTGLASRGQSFPESFFRS